jgi:cell division septation protein DedD
MKKGFSIILAIFIALLIVACPRRDNNLQPLNEHNTSSMQDIAETLEQPILADTSDIAEELPTDITQTTIPTTPTVSTPTTPPVSPPPATPASNPPPANPPATPSTTTTSPRERPVEFGEYTAQFMSLKDRGRVDEVRRLLLNASYNTEIQEVEVNGETLYRLRLAGSFSRSYAQYLAQKIKNEHHEITDFWVTRR